MIKCVESGHAVLRCSGPLSRGVLKSKGGGITAIHHNADPCTAELLLTKLECRVNLNCKFRAFLALALESSFILDHITRGLGPESNHRKQV